MIVANTRLFTSVRTTSRSMIEARASRTKTRAVMSMLAARKQ